METIGKKFKYKLKLPQMGWESISVEELWNSQAFKKKYFKWKIVYEDISRKKENESKKKIDMYFE